MKKVRTFQVQLSALTQNDLDDSASTDLMNLNLSELSGCHFEGTWNALNLASYSTPFFLLRSVMGIFVFVFLLLSDSSLLLSESVYEVKFVSL